jgi:hypothetical protein
MTIPTQPLPARFSYVKAQPLARATHAQFNERWVQDRIAADPSILGLGDLVLRDRERSQPRAGRLDLLLQDPDTLRRYEVELQLGKTDEAHLIRAIEYWDIERKRYPQYEHCAVIVAEDITSRFLNVMGLFNGSVPLIAIQMNAIAIGDQVTLVFTRVLDELTRGLVDEDEETQETTDRSYWEGIASKPSLATADEVLRLVRTFEPRADLTYRKHYIGFAIEGASYNFAVMRPRKSSFTLKMRLDAEEQYERALEEAGLEVMDYDKRWRAYRIRLDKADVGQHAELLTRMLKAAYDARFE